MTEYLQSRCLIFLLCLACLSYSRSSEATSAVVIVDQDRIIIGTDSLWRGSKAGAALKCKISTRKSACIYVIVGLRNKPETAFDSSKFADHACESGNSIQDAAAAFGNSVRTDLRHAIRYSRLHDPVLYKRNYRGKAVLEGLFAGFDHDKPIVAIKSFTLDEHDRIHEKLTELPDSEGNNIALDGEQNAANAFLKSHHDWRTVEYPALVRTLIETEISDKPEKVGGPIDVLVIEKNGHHWIAPYGTCGP
jgi:hypothetical protein